MNEEIANLFGGGTAGAGQPRRLAVLTRHGHPLLYLPRKRVLARQALDLYPAQRTGAILASRLWRLVCAVGLTPALPTTSLVVNPNTPFSQFLSSLIGEKTVPAFAILAGNPHAPGRRFIFLVFDTRNQPLAVVKAGGNHQAIELIEHEASILEAIVAQAAGVPRLRAVHRSEGLRALALDYATGASPRMADSKRMAEVLGSWINRTTRLKADDVPAWQRLVKSCSHQPVLRSIRAKVELASFHPVLYHGDFAPWNVKVAGSGSWQALDWERGEPIGMPGWDWFHYQVQTGLLVQRLTTEAHAREVERWLQEEPLLRYANDAGVVLILRELFLAYLLYSMEIIGPSQSLPAKRDLLNTLAAQWKSA